MSPSESLLAQVNKNYWDLTFQAILGKLYVISLFVTLCDVVAIALLGFISADRSTAQERTRGPARRCDDWVLHEPILESGLGLEHPDPSRCTYTYIAAPCNWISCV